MRANEEQNGGVCLVVGRTSADHVMITPAARTTVTTGDPWHISFRAAIDIRSGDFSGRINGSFMLGDFSSFLTELEALSANVHGRARFISSDGWITLELVGDRLGHIAVSGRAKDHRGQELKFELKPELDQTFLEKICFSLRQIVGRP
jgi:hypothetical protein